MALSIGDHHWSWRKVEPERIAIFTVCVMAAIFVLLWVGLAYDEPTSPKSLFAVALNYIFPALVWPFYLASWLGLDRWVFITWLLSGVSWGIVIECLLVTAGRLIWRRRTTAHQRASQLNEKPVL